MEALEAVIVLILTVLLMFIVMSPATWSSSPSSAAKAAGCDGEPYEHPSSCISSRLDFVFSPSPACSPYSLFDDDSASCHNTDNSSSSINDTAIASDTPIPSTDLEPAAPVHDLAPPALCAP